MTAPPLHRIALISALGFAATVIAFQTGRRSVGGIEGESVAPKPAPVSQQEERRDAAATPQPLRDATMRNMATVPFTQLYDVLRSASPEQLRAWAEDLERMPRGPKHRAAVAGYYKSLVQVDHRAAIDAVLHTQNLAVRDVAIEALLTTAPETSWAAICEMMDHLTYPGRTRPIYSADPFRQWSRVDPVAASKYLESKPDAHMQGALEPLLRNWASIDASAAKTWMEESSARQTEEGIQALLLGWASTDAEGVIDYTLSNVSRADFAKGITELAYSFLRKRHPDEARALIAGLPREKAAQVVHHIASETTTLYLHGPADFQRPPEEVARWMATLPSGLWEQDLGVVFDRWFREDNVAARAWLDQLPTPARDTTVADMCRNDETGEVLPLALTISNQRVRDEAVRALLRQLQAHEALQTLHDLEISPVERQYVLRLLTEEAKNGN